MVDEAEYIEGRKEEESRRSSSGTEVRVKVRFSVPHWVFRSGGIMHVCSVSVSSNSQRTRVRKVHSSEQRMRGRVRVMKLC